MTIGGETRSVKDAIQDDAWLADNFIKTVQTRGAAIINARKAYVVLTPLICSLIGVHSVRSDRSWSAVNVSRRRWQFVAVATTLRERRPDWRGLLQWWWLHW